MPIGKENSCGVSDLICELFYANCFLFILVCFLLSLVDHEEIGELDFSDIVGNNKSMFATLLTNEENMKVWLLIT